MAVSEGKNIDEVRKNLQPDFCMMIALVGKWGQSPFSVNGVRALFQKTEKRALTPFTV